MAETPYNHYALYGPDASPDLTATGEYNRAIMAIDSDMHAEETERSYADKQLSDRITTLGNQETADVRDLNAKILAEEMNRVSADSGLATDIDNEKKARTSYDALIEREYKAADTALGKRIDNAEVEISANSADLTGIKSLTYGAEHVQFLEHDNGSYSSPALDEIAKQVDALKAGGWTVITPANPTLTKDELSTLKSAWPMVVIKQGALYFPSNYTQSGYTLVVMGYTPIVTADNKPMASNPVMRWLTVKWDGSLNFGEPLRFDSGRYYVLNKIVNDGTTFTEEEIDAIAAHAPLVIIAQGDIAMACYFERITSNYIYFFQTMPDDPPQMNSYIINRTTRIAKRYNQRIGSVTTAGITPDTRWGTIEA